MARKDEMSQTSGSGEGGARPPADPAATTPEAVEPAPQLRRKPVLLAASVAAVVLGALMGVWAWSAMSDTEGVVAVRESVSRGETIEMNDLVVVHVGVDPQLDTVPDEGLQSMVGQRAASDLPAGTLLTPGVTTSKVVPRDGQSVVGVAVNADQMPGMELRAGDRIRVISTAGSSGQDQQSGLTGQNQPAEPAEVRTEVVSLHKGDQPGTTVVSVLVPEDRAAELASQVSTGRVSIVLDSRER
ncbi:SAF domain-containing protein [Janibacter alittae]|uniref:SAF domain-containing protein n=1 Tax=Janibacter alittae TaxID=3115209 RepID=A0ABZ2MLC8_9MICO